MGAQSAGGRNINPKYNIEVARRTLWDYDIDTDFHLRLGAIFRANQGQG